MGVAPGVVAGLWWWKSLHGRCHLGGWLVAGRPPGAEAGVNAQPAADRGLVDGGCRWNIPALGAE